MKTLMLGGLSLALLATAASAADMAAVAQARHDHYKEIGKNMKAIGDSLKSGAPDAKAIAGYAKRIDELAPQVPSWFPEGSGPGHGFKTQAKAEVWERPEEFRKDAQAFAAQADKLYKVSETGSIPQIAAETKALGETCKTCHQTFKAKDD